MKRRTFFAFLALPSAVLAGNAAAAIGKTLAVKPLPLKMPIGMVLPFEETESMAMSGCGGCDSVAHGHTHSYTAIEVKRIVYKQFDGERWIVIDQLKLGAA